MTERLRLSEQILCDTLADHRVDYWVNYKYKQPLV